MCASCQVGSGDPLVLGYTTQPSASILIFIIVHDLQLINKIYCVSVGGSRRGPSSNDWKFAERTNLGDHKSLMINYKGISYIIWITVELTYDNERCISCYQIAFQMNQWNGKPQAFFLCFIRSVIRCLLNINAWLNNTDLLINLFSLFNIRYAPLFVNKGIGKWKLKKQYWLHFNEGICEIFHPNKPAHTALLLFFMLCTMIFV